MYLKKMKNWERNLFITGKGRCNIDECRGYGHIVFFGDQQSEISLQRVLWIYQRADDRIF